MKLKSHIKWIGGRVVHAGDTGVYGSVDGRVVKGTVVKCAEGENFGYLVVEDSTNYRHLLKN